MNELHHSHNPLEKKLSCNLNLIVSNKAQTRRKSQLGLIIESYYERTEEFVSRKTEALTHLERDQAQVKRSINRCLSVRFLNISFLQFLLLRTSSCLSMGF